MSPVVETIIFGLGCAVWGGLIILGMSPELGARVGLWLRSVGAEKDDIEVQSWREWPGSSSDEDNAYKPDPDSQVGKNLDRFV
jgi:hypothetical protein